MSVTWENGFSEGFHAAENHLQSSQTQGLLTLQPAGHGAGWAPLSVPSCSSHKAWSRVPQNLQNWYQMLPCWDQGMRVPIPCPFYIESTHILSLYFVPSQPWLLNIYYLTTSSQWIIKPPFYLGRGWWKTIVQSGVITCQKHITGQGQNLNLHLLIPIPGFFPL